ncbi:MAG: HAD family hydrolase [Pseudomonadota bacterium]
MKLFLFDIDGTLLLSGGAGDRSLAKSFKKCLNCEETTEDILPDGKTDYLIIKEIFKKKFPKKELTKKIADSILENYIAYLKTEVPLSPQFKIMSGVISTLNELKDSKNVVIGLATGNIEEGARIKLERANLNRFFTFGGFGSDAEDRTEILKIAATRGIHEAKEIIANDSIYVIGDTPYDIQSAKKAGFKSIAVTTGSFTKKELLKENPDYIYEDFNQLKEDIKKEKI